MSLLTKWLNLKLKIYFLLSGLFIATISVAQVARLTLPSALTLAEKSYPLTRQKEVLKQSEDLQLRNITTAYLPQVAINGTASYQSDVTRINLPIPNIKPPEQSRDQYKVYADVSQLLYDGGATREQATIQRRTTEIEQGKLDIELYQLKGRITQLYLAILFQQQLMKQTDLLLRDIQQGIDKVKPMVENGTALRSSLLVLEAQKLQAQQRQAEIRNAKKGYLESLSTLLQSDVEENTLFETPILDITEDTVVKRPEITLFQQQSRLLEEQKSFINSRTRPKFSAFTQLGFGDPALNQFSSGFEPYYIAGLRLNWSLSGFYTKRREKQLVELNQKTVALQEESFLLNTRSQLDRLGSEINKFNELIASDQAIINIREKITNASRAQLENAVITTSDYLREVTAEDQARQNLILHQVQLLQAKADYAITAGKL